MSLQTIRERLAEMDELKHSRHIKIQILDYFKSTLVFLCLANILGKDCHA